MNNDAIIYCSKKNFKNKIDGLLLNDSLTRRTLHSSLEEAIGSIVSWEVLVVVTTHNYKAVGSRHVMLQGKKHSSCSLISFHTVAQQMTF